MCIREATKSYAEGMRQVATSIMRFLGMALDVEDPKFYEASKEGICDIRINFYPPCPEPERVIGINPHADVLGITLLLECGVVPGLQVLKYGQWVIVQPIDDALVVDLGGITEVKTSFPFK